jgi:hypothetical protein
VGWVLLAFSAIVLLVEMKRWAKIVPAIFIYQMMVVLYRLFFGHSTGYGASRLETAWLAVLYAAIAVVSTTIALRELNRLDRVVLTGFVGFFLWGFAGMPTLGIRSGLIKMTIGLGCLLVAFVYDRLQHRRRDRLSSSHDKGASAPSSEGPIRS